MRVAPHNVIDTTCYLLKTPAFILAGVYFTRGCGAQAAIAGTIRPQGEFVSSFAQFLVVVK